MGIVWDTETFVTFPDRVRWRKEYHQIRKRLAEYKTRLVEATERFEALCMHCQNWRTWQQKGLSNVMGWWEMLPRHLAGN